ncbi:hypothetical protein MG290_01940 [Flavobacterium sp. CBA20B-1]|uniref:hypothetical protein n=1 Tax=unclassified Flavobacterium TaxID=196869 RepID=UPI00222535E1|nr:MULTISPECIES: hypothetical protein [unclassified Flavobacterium]WCM42456.1 hypothetical protein MG290_01940 [Flavobacterium sp. CBA20B-1]
MKRITYVLMLTFLLFSYTAVSQVKFSDDLKLFQYKYQRTAEIISLEDFKKKLIELNFVDFINIDNTIYAKNFFTKMIYGSAMEIHYSIKIEKTQNNISIIFSNFKINDVRYGKVALEELKSKHQKRWIEEIDKRIPGVINQINN